MFVRRKTVIGGLTRYCLVENRRVNGRVRQRVLYYLGEHSTVEAALKHLLGEESRLRRLAEEEQARLRDADPRTALQLMFSGRDRAIIEAVACLERRADWFAAEAARLRHIAGVVPNSFVRDGLGTTCPPASGTEPNT